MSFFIAKTIFPIFVSTFKLGIFAAVSAFSALILIIERSNSSSFQILSTGYSLSSMITL
jgi:hypothetical protein